MNYNLKIKYKNYSPIFGKLKHNVYYQSIYLVGETLSMLIPKLDKNS